MVATTTPNTETLVLQAVVSGTGWHIGIPGSIEKKSILGIVHVGVTEDSALSPYILMNFKDGMALIRKINVANSTVLGVRHLILLITEGSFRLTLFTNL